MEASGAGATWALPRHVPWPGVRGEKLLALFTHDGESLVDATGFDCDSSAFREKKEKDEAPYELELCVPTAGHIALVLVRTTPKAEPATPVPLRHSVTAPVAGSTPANAPATHARVVYVVDAVPPRRRKPTGLNAKKSWSSMSIKSSGRNNVNGSASSSLSSSASAGAAAKLSITPVPTDVNELELIDDLFSTPKTAAKDASLIARAPLLCARFDCKIVALTFTRSSSSNLAKKAAVTPSTLRCVLATEDGTAYVWEWGVDLHQWTFLNRFCFLENPNLQWTRPVVAFTVTEMAWHGQSTELTWWSTESKQEPKLWLRKIQFEQEKSTFRTEIILGSAFSLDCHDVIALKSSKLGLWMLTKTGVYFRSAESLRTISHSWQTLLPADATTTEDEATKDVMTTQLKICLHNVTGELLVLVRETGALILVTPKAGSTDKGTLVANRSAVLASWSKKLAQSVRSIAGHRHLLLVLTRDHELIAFSMLTGERMKTIQVSTPQAASSSLVIPPCSVKPLQFWTMDGQASSTGLWSPTGFWRLQTPSAQSIGLNHLTQQQNAPAAYLAVKNYGECLKFDMSLFALEVLEKAASSLEMYQQPAWRAACETISSPALLLATFADHKTPERLLDDLSLLITSIYRVAHEILVTGRFGSMLEKNKATTETTRGMPHLTKSNLESLHHLSNWVLLARRKLARLQTSATIHGKPSLRTRAVSALATAVDEDDLYGFSSPLENNDPDASTFQLSRKLRPMSSLRFAAGSTSIHHGREWLAQLELYLLDGVKFKGQDRSTKSALSVSADHKVPNHVLFHDERVLDDYRASASSLFSKHMYLETMGRLYLLHEPSALLAFVECVTQFCPRYFSLSGDTTVSRTHAERALTLLPPVQLFVNKVLEEKQRQQLMTSDISGLGKHHRQKKRRSLECATPKDSLLAYVDLLCSCGYYMEACRALLQCDLYEVCKEKLLLRPFWFHAQSVEPETDSEKELQHVHGAVYFELLEHCVLHREATELMVLIQAKPDHIDALHVLRTLRACLKEPEASGSSPASSRKITVGHLRPVLVALLKQRQRSASKSVAVV